jgi:hypothetical protein
VNGGNHKARCRKEKIKGNIDIAKARRAGFSIAFFLVPA